MECGANQLVVVLRYGQRINLVDGDTEKYHL